MFKIFLKEVLTSLYMFNYTSRTEYNIMHDIKTQHYTSITLFKRKCTKVTKISIYQVMCR